MDRASGLYFKRCKEDGKIHEDGNHLRSFSESFSY